MGNETNESPRFQHFMVYFFQVKFPSLQMYSRSNVLLNRYLTRITYFLHTLKKCHTIVVFTIAQRLIDLSLR